MKLKSLSDRELVHDLERICLVSRKMLVRMLAYLIEVDDRMLYAKLAYPSLFEFCLRKLGMSEGEAYRRIAGARVLKRVPALSEWLASGRVHLTTIVKLRELWTTENVNELAEAVAGKSKLEVDRELARRRPQPDVPDAIRKLPARELVSTPSASAPAEASPAMAPTSSLQAASSSPIASSAPNRELVHPLAADRFKIQFTASEGFRRKLEDVQNMLRHRHPRGELEAIFELALDALTARLEKERFAETDRPQTKERPAAPGHVRAATRRGVVRRDGRQCAYRAEDGTRCTARGHLELEHCDPRGKGGSSEAENLAVYCRTHNQLRAREVYGAAHIAKVIAVRAHTRSRAGASGPLDLAKASSEPAQPSSIARVEPAPSTG